MTIVVIFDTVNIFFSLDFQVHQHGGIPPNCNGTANLYLAFGYYYSLQRYISTIFMSFLEIDSYNQ